MESSLTKMAERADEQIARFEGWFTRPRPDGLGEAPLTRYERAILKTFLVHHALGKFEKVELTS